jgi:hypothetical protein
MSRLYLMALHSWQRVSTLDRCGGGGRRGGAMDGRGGAQVRERPRGVAQGVLDARRGDVTRRSRRGPLTLPRARGRPAALRWRAYAQRACVPSERGGECVIQHGRTPQEIRPPRRWVIRRAYPSAIPGQHAHGIEPRAGGELVVCCYCTSIPRPKAVVHRRWSRARQGNEEAEACTRVQARSPRRWTTRTCW